MPIASEDFLWLDDAKKGVFFPADRVTKQSLSAEQTLFALDVLYFDPIGQVFSSLRNATQEFFAIGLDELYVSHERLQFYQKDVLPEYLEKLKHGRIVSSDKFLAVSEMIFLRVYIISICGLLLIGLMWWYLDKDAKRRNLRHDQYKLMLAIAVTAIVLNAAICGVFGRVVERYQTRVSWVPLFMLLLTTKYILESRRNTTESRVSMKIMARLKIRPIAITSESGFGEQCASRRVLMAAKME